MQSNLPKEPDLPTWGLEPNPQSQSHNIYFQWIYYGLLKKSAFLYRIFQTILVIAIFELF